ncbi:MAG: NAD(P)H-dependent oxidoreductase subunit E [Bacillota bacterium]|jgi:NADH:ubiquinone oxidoreductase subunit E
MSTHCNCGGGSQLPRDYLAGVDKIIDPYRGQPGNLIQVLHQTQGLLGYLPREVQQRVAEGLNVPLTRVSGVVSFYSFFTMAPKGRHKINVCAGTACYVRGAYQLINKLGEDLAIKPGETSEDGEFSLDLVRCVGACGLGPVVMVDNDVYGRVETEKLPGIVAKYKKEE